jgi:hypothetical protein
LVDPQFGFSQNDDDVKIAVVWKSKAAWSSIDVGEEVYGEIVYIPPYRLVAARY